MADSFCSLMGFYTPLSVSDWPAGSSFVLHLKYLPAKEGRPLWFVTVRADQLERLRVIEAAGFARQDRVAVHAIGKVWLRHSGSVPMDSLPLPQGFLIRPLAGAAEVESYVALHRAAFQSTSMTTDWRQRILLRPEYTPACDLVVEAPDGRLAAFCIAWFSPRGCLGQPAGQIEPLGVHPDFQRRGLGRALLLAAMRQLHERSAQDIYVESDNAPDSAYPLYRSVGFALCHTLLVCRRDV